MRYGYVLAQYSVPEWKAYAVDYDEFKELIKNTVVLGAGVGNEDIIYAALSEQIDRVNIFVRSKAGELDRRIRNCNKAVEVISKQDAARTYPVSNAQRQRPILRIESEIESLYHELQSLARFVSSHKIAFRKLVKAYNKRSQTSSLSSRFSVIIDNPKSFAKRDFTPLIVELSFLYDLVRRYFQSSLRFFSQSHSTMGDLDFEASSSIAPNSLSFWVHEDNCVELEVYLLKYLSIMPNESFFRRNISEYEVHSDTRMVYLNSDNALENILSIKKFSDEVSKIVADVDIESAEAILCTPGGASLTGKKKFIESIVNSSASQQEIQQLDSIGKSVVGWLKKNNAKPSILVGAKRVRYEQIGTSGSTVWASLDSSIKYRTIDSATGWTDLGSARDYSSFPYSVLEIRWQGSEPKWLYDLKASHTVYEVSGFNYFSHAACMLHLSQQQPTWLRLLVEDIHKLPKQSMRLRLKSRKTSSGKCHAQVSSSSSSSSATVEGNSSVETPPENMPITVANASVSGLRHNSTTPVGQRASSIISSIFSARAISPSPAPERRKGPSAEAIRIAQLGRGRINRGRQTYKPSDRRLTIMHHENNESRYWNEFDHPDDDDEATFYVDVDNSTSDSGTLTKLSDWSNSIWSRVSKKVQSISDIIEESPSRRAANDAEREGLLQSNDHDADVVASHIFSTPSDLESGGRPQSILGFHDTISLDRALTMFYAVSFSISLVLVGILDGIIFVGQHSAAPVYVSMLASIGLVFAEMIALAGVTAYLWRHSVPGALHQIIVFLAMLTIVCGGVGGVLVILF
ncbi:uncharacterized protein V2V93DRAFT_363587 [Kockiozyma suomiensis]|uniref:uncharacterized protein n=1 Tax=Kockiozyma suomiensis TaxID=1337062 RepID=UPI0033432194